MIGLTLEDGYLDMDLEYRDGLKASILLSILIEKNSSWIAGKMELGNEYKFSKLDNVGTVKRHFLETVDWMLQKEVANDMNVEVEKNEGEMMIYLNTELQNGEKRRINFYFQDGVLKNG